MKTLFLIFLLLTQSLLGTVVFTYTPNLNDQAIVMGIFLSKGELRPCVATYTPGGIGLTAIGYKSVRIDCSIPSILIGQNTYKEFEGLMYYGGGKQVQAFNPADLWWLKSRWLGMVYVEHYPMVYSTERGWAWVVEDEAETDYWLYYFDSQTWTNYNLTSLGITWGIQIGHSIN